LEMIGVRIPLNFGFFLKEIKKFKFHYWKPLIRPKAPRKMSAMPAFFGKSSYYMRIGLEFFIGIELFTHDWIIDRV
jgi:hypothetical protein